MAKGTDSEEFALLSGPRTGLKREFAFALKSYERTRWRRSGNGPSSDGDVEGSSRKRLKSFVEVGEEEKKVVEEVFVNEEPLNDSIRSQCKEDEETLNGSVKSACREDSMSVELKLPRAEEPINNGEESCMEGTGIETPILIDNQSEINNAVMEKPFKRFTRSALKPKEQQKETDECSNVNSVSAEKPMKRFTRSALGTPDSQQMVIDGNDQVESKSNRGLPDKPMRRFTRSVLGSSNAEKMVRDDNGQVESNSPEIQAGSLVPPSDPLVLKPTAELMEVDSGREVENCEVQIAPLEKSCHALEPSAEQMPVDGNGEVKDHSCEKTSPNCAALEPKEGQMVKDDSGKVHNASQLKTLKRFTRASLGKDDTREVHNTSPFKTPRCFTPSVLEPEKQLMVITEISDQPSALPEAPMRRFTRSALESKTDLLVVDVDKDPQNAPSEDPACRFTHSVLKPNAMMMSDSCDLPNASPAETVRHIRFTRSALKPKEDPLEISAIASTGGSSTASEETCRSETELLGAKSKLEMKMSKKIAWPLGTLDTTLQNVIGSSPINNSTICLVCKGHLPSDFRKALQLCDSCLEAKKNQGLTARTVGTHARFSKSVLNPGSLTSASECSTSQKKTIKGKITRKDLRLHKLVFEEDGLPDGTELAYYIRGKKLLEGYKKGFGIFCHCCNSVVSPSTFEAHAGCAARRKPFHQIYTSNGVSLHELSLSLSKGRKFSSNDNDDLCGICGDGGNLLLCDGCPRAFHKDCVGQSSIPQGKWYCPYCQRNFEQEQLSANNENAKAAGRILGIDPMEEISKRCIRIVKTTEPEVGGCVLCRCHSFCRVGFGPRTVILCDQCEKEFHVGCLKDHNIANLKELPKGEWFCCPECNRIHSVLQKLIMRGSEELPDSISCVIKGKPEGKCLNSDAGIDVRWRLLNGKVATPESRSLLSKAVTIFHDRFDPIVDSTTGRDLIPSMVYGRKRGYQEYGGMYCAVLTVNSSVVSAGILRIFGQEIAELPLVATSADYQGQGYFQSLFCCIERLLGFLKVKNLVLPAAEEAEAIWTNRFGFQKISNEQLSNYRKHCQMTIFQGTSMLQKPVPKCRVIDRPKKDS